MTFPRSYCDYMVASDLGPDLVVYNSPRPHSLLRVLGWVPLAADPETRTRAHDMSLEVIPGSIHRQVGKDEANTECVISRPPQKAIKDSGDSKEHIAG